MNPKIIYLALAFLTGILLVRIIIFYNSVEKYSAGQIISWQTQVTAQPKLKIRGQQVTISMPNYQRVTVNFKLMPTISYGDSLAVRGTLDYFEAEDGRMVAFMNYPEFKIIEKGSESSFIVRMREKIIDFFNSSLPQNYSALMLGIVFGIKEEMTPDFYLDLQKVGLMHVIAASGMNITMLGGFLSMFFTILFRRQLAIVLTILSIIFYACLAGLEPSIVRAAIMGIIVFLAQLSGRQNSSFLALFFAAFIMLMRSPSLLFDVGFQLSFLATFGLIYLRPIFSFIPIFKKFLNKSVLVEDLATTLTAQIMTLPILLINFGSYSFWSIPVNAIVLWTVPILMIIGGISVIIAFVIEPVGRIVLYFSVPFLLYFIKIVDLFGNFQGQIDIKSLPIILVCGYYLLLFSIVMYIKNKR